MRIGCALSLLLLAAPSLAATQETPAQDAPESAILGGAEAEPTRPSVGTAEGPTDPVPDRPPAN